MNQNLTESVVRSVRGVVSTPKMTVAALVASITAKELTPEGLWTDNFCPKDELVNRSKNLMKVLTSLRKANRVTDDMMVTFQNVSDDGETSYDSINLFNGSNLSMVAFPEFPTDTGTQFVLVTCGENDQATIEWEAPKAVKKTKKAANETTPETTTVATEKRGRGRPRDDNSMLGRVRTFLTENNASKEPLKKSKDILDHLEKTLGIPRTTATVYYYKARKELGLS